MSVTSRPIHDEAKCANCPAPLHKRRGRWEHPWLYRNACTQPTAIPESIRLDTGK